MRRALCLSWFLALWLGLPGCGGQETQADVGPAGVARADTLTPTASGVARYGVALAAQHPRIAEAVQEAVGERRRKTPDLDLALSATAALVAAGIQPGDQPSNDLLAFAASHCGIVEPIPVLGAVTSTGASDKQVAESLAKLVTESVASNEANLLGVGVAKAPNGAQTVVVLMSERAVSLKPVPRALKKDQQVPISGEVERPYRTPRVVVNPPTGQPVTLPTQVDGRAFSATVRCDTPGVHRVEVMADGKAGPKVLANFPVWCQKKPPTTFGLKAEDDDSVKAPRAAEKRLFELTNEARATAGLAALRWDEEAAEVARGHAQDMKKHGYVAHVSPRTGDVGDRVRKAGLQATEVRENLGLASDADAIHRGLMDSPAHREAILAPNATRLGVGAVSRKTGSGTELIAVEVFLDDPAKLDAKAARATTLRALGSKGLKEDASLSALAERAAQDLAKGRVSADDVGKSMSKGLGKTQYSRARTLIHMGPEPERLAADNAVKAKGAKAFGLGMATGKLKGQRTYFAVLLLGEP